MSALEILAVIGIIGYTIYRQVRGEPLRGKRAVLLPAILTVIGFTDLHASNGAHLQTTDLVCIVVGTAGSALIGLAFGAVMRLESRGGHLWAQLPVRGLWLWAAMVGWRVVMILLATGMHAHVAASSSTLLFSLGVNRLAQAAVVVPRAIAMGGVTFAPEKDGSTFLPGLFDRSNGLAARGAGAQIRDRFNDRFDTQGAQRYDTRSDVRYDTRYDVRHDPRDDSRSDSRGDSSNDPRDASYGDSRDNSYQDSRPDNYSDSRSDSRFGPHSDGPFGPRSDSPFGSRHDERRAQRRAERHDSRRGTREDYGRGSGDRS